MRVRLVMVINIAASLAIGACGSEPTSTADTSVTTTTDTTTDTSAPPPTWSITTVEGERAGRQIQAAVLPDGTPVVAAYLEGGAPDGACYAAEPAAGDRTAWTLRYAVPDGDGWSVEDVASIVHLGSPRGFDLAIDADGEPVIAALTGEPDAVARYCGANDLGLWRRSGAEWSVDVAASTSADAATGEPASDFGTVVGLWPALAFAPDGAAVIAYKDVHGGGLQGDDFTRADLEVAWQDGGGWAHTAVDWGKGAGDYAAAAFDGEGRLVLLQFNPRDDLAGSERGLWALRSDDAGATWERVRLHAGGTGERPSLAIDEDGEVVWVAWYDGALGLPMVASLDDPERFAERSAWVVEDVGDRVYDEGRHPAIAVSEDGLVGLAYQRCGRASDGIGDCNPARDAVVFAWRDGPVWDREVVAEEPDGICGGFTSLVWAGDRPAIFYQCNVEVTGGFASELRAARRRGPP